MTTSGATALPPSPSPFAVFRHRDFSLMWLGQLVDTIGSSLTSLAASILIYRETGSAASVGLMLIATAAPGLVFGLIAGVFVDRYDRKKIMIGANLIRAVIVFLIPILVPMNIAWLYVLVALSSIVGQFFDPAHESVLPEVAPDEELAAANSLMAISSFGSTAIGFAAAGLLASLGDIKWAFYVDTLTFLLSAVFIALIHIKPMEITGKTSAAVVARNLRSGLGYLFETPILRSLFLVSIPVLIAFGLTNAILLPFSERALDMTEFQFGIQEGVTSIGFVVGSLIMATIAGRLFEGQWLTIGYVGMGIIYAFYSQSTTIPIAITLLFFGGFMNAPASIARRLVIQRHSPREMRGRVSSAFFVSRDILFLVGMAVAALADVVDVRTMFLIAAITILATGIIAQFLPGLRHGAAQWRSSLGLLRAAQEAPRLDVGRPATPAYFELLAGMLPQFSGLNAKEREIFLTDAKVIEAPAKTAVIRYGEASEETYFIIAGQTFAGLTDEGGDYHSMSIMKAGDFFGEIAALTGAPRSADVVTTEPTILLKITAHALRRLMSNPAISHLFLTTLRERQTDVRISDMPRFTGYHQGDLRELRTA